MRFRFLLLIVCGLGAAVGCFASPFGDGESSESAVTGSQCGDAGSPLDRLGPLFDRAKFDAMRMGKWKTSIRTKDNNVNAVTPWEENANNCTGCKAACSTCHSKNGETKFVNAEGNAILPKDYTFDQTKKQPFIGAFFELNENGKPVASQAVNAKSDATKLAKSYSHPLFSVRAKDRNAIAAFQKDVLDKYYADPCNGKPPVADASVDGATQTDGGASSEAGSSSSDAGPNGSDAATSGGDSGTDASTTSEPKPDAGDKGDTAAKDAGANESEDQDDDSSDDDDATDNDNDSADDDGSGKADDSKTPEEDKAATKKPVKKAAESCSFGAADPDTTTAYGAAALLALGVVLARRRQRKADNLGVIES
jgi:MYXO-CTERM domain-containing protein